MLTADTITDEQMRELREEAAKLAKLNLESHSTWVEIVELCNDALAAPLGLSCRAQARARCAEILNARAAKSDECSTCGAIHVDVDCFGKVIR